MKYAISTLLFLALNLLWLGCAKQGAPTGGPKDAAAPKVLTEKSTRNFSTQFNQRSFDLSFDEWVQLRDASTQMVVSPPLDKQPKISLKGKTVTVALDKDEQLRSNTTYTFNFGTGVRDLHEGNAAEDLRFVFSTGDAIDSLLVQGNVLDALTGAAVENAAVMLYETEADSVVAKEKPYYYARTNKAGQFLISNVRPGRFKCVAVAFEDGNRDLRWKGGAVKIAFTDSMLTIQDSLLYLPVLRIFKDQPAPRLLDKQTSQYGLAKLIYTSPPDGIGVKASLDSTLLISRQIADTLMVWYDVPVDTSWQIVAGLDTVKIKTGSRANFLETFKTTWASNGIGGAGSGFKAKGKPAVPAAGSKAAPKIASLGVGQNLVLDFNTPIAAIDTSLWEVRTDSTRVYGLQVMPDSLAPATLQIAGPFLAEKTYEILLLPGAVGSMYGPGNPDTLRAVLNVLSEKQLGALNLNMEALKPGQSYLLQLLDGEKILDSRRFVQAADQTIRTEKFLHLQPRAYTARLIEDDNGNARWDSGDYYAHRQPERVFTKKLDALRADWELDATFKVGGK